jgi:hypothetical protein
VLDRGHRGVGGVLDVDEGPDAGPVADDRELALPDRLHVLAAILRIQRGAGAVEAAVAQHDPLRPVGAGHGLLQVEDGVERRPHAVERIGVERVVL